MQTVDLAPHAPPELPYALRILLENVLVAGDGPWQLEGESIELRLSRI